jgi:hypothetical protein
MVKFLQFTLWNANGLTQHPEEIKTFISIHNIDVMLISGMHFTEKSYLKLPNYAVYHMNHPAGTVRGGTVIIIKHSIKHHQLHNYSLSFLQATCVGRRLILLTILGVYLLPRYTVKQELEDFYNTIGRRFTAGGDYNAKHTNWRSRLITSKGYELLKKMESNNLKHLSGGEPTYWPPDRNKLPHLVDLCLTKGIPQDFTVKQRFDLSSDHSSVLITLTAHTLNHEKQPSLSNRQTNWDDFRSLINENLSLIVSFETEEDNEAAVKQQSSSSMLQGTLECKARIYRHTQGCSILIKQKCEEERRLCRDWHRL